MEKLDALQTQEAIGFVKKTFSEKLSRKLKLTPVSSPIAIIDGTGINDDLNGTERPVRFRAKALEQLGTPDAVVVQSLAKWKRLRLKELAVPPHRGILTHMHALRPDEVLSPIHSIYVDQWDWEKHILPSDRHLDYLKKTVKKIYKALRVTEQKVYRKYPHITPVLPSQITFMHAEELLKEYPDLSAAERENEAAKKYGAIFIIGIGNALSDGKPHDGRAPDYDDWSTPGTEHHTGLNGDIIVWNPVLEKAFEISSMGIRVDKKALVRQLEICKCPERSELYFHQLILNDRLPLSIGGGIGQSRVCMFLLRKQHIGQVQVGIWPETVVSQLSAGFAEVA